MSIKSQIRKCLWRVGYDLSRFDPISHPVARKQYLLKQFRIDLVLDVGANTGDFAAQLRELGYIGRIVSFEPLTSAFQVLQRRAARDGKWTALNHALGDDATTTEINVAGNSSSSSLLNMLPSHLKASPESEYIARQTIRVETLDSVFSGVCPPGATIYLKIDTQGFEDRVLNGAEKSLSLIDTIQIELSLVPLYENGVLFPQIYESLTAKGYRLVSLEPVFSDPDTGQLLQMDGVFHRF